MNDDEHWTHTHAGEKKEKKRCHLYVEPQSRSFPPPVVPSASSSSSCWIDKSGVVRTLMGLNWRPAVSNYYQNSSRRYKNRPVVESSSTSTYVTAGTCVCCYSRRNRCNPFPLSPRSVPNRRSPPPRKLMSTDVVDTRARTVSGYVGASFLFPSKCIRPTAWKFDDYTPHIHTHARIQLSGLCGRYIGRQSAAQPIIKSNKQQHQIPPPPQQQQHTPHFSFFLWEETEGGNCTAVPPAFHGASNGVSCYFSSPSKKRNWYTASSAKFFHF
jgi:hypothetical protein